MKCILLTIFFSLSILSIYAQDIHFSQMDINAAMRNPATMGQMPAGNQLTLGYRSQWSSLPAAYRNINVAFEQRRAAFSWGTSILHNDAGRNSLRNTQLLMNFSYQKRLSERDEILAIGGSVGAMQQRFQPELMEFDNQYVLGEGVNNSLSNGENFYRTNQILPTVSAGVFLSKYLGRIKGSAGLSFAHLNRPASQFFEGQKEYYPIRTSLFASARLFFRKKLRGEVRYAWNNQSVANETLLGAKMSYELSPDNWLVFGLGNRLNDAIIFEAGMKFEYSSFTLSYDMNNSKFVPVTNSRGALELSATYSFGKKDNYKQMTVAMPFPEKRTQVEQQEEELEEQMDSDGDGIVDNRDECPDFPGLVQFNGCNDTDQDGVWNHIDACPNLYGAKENRGCPTKSIDSDKDGILDEMDDCPFLKGEAEMRGCPDTDSDGVSDMIDKCPFLKGSKNNNGCPDMERENYQQFIQKKSARVLVEFNTNQAVIQKQYFERLDEIALVLLENPTAGAFVSGHTDDEGNSEYNFQLGEQRALAIKEHFIAVGVSPEQITVISYGEIKPRNANKYAYGKAKNRRAEVTVYLK